GAEQTAGEEGDRQDAGQRAHQAPARQQVADGRDGGDQMAHGAADSCTPSPARSIVIPSCARQTRARVPSQWPRASANSCSRSSSLWYGSWWNSTTCEASAMRAKSITCSTQEWPQPTWRGYSLSPYWASWKSTS